MGVVEGFTLGDAVGVLEGTTLGDAVGVLEGTTLGDAVGVLEGTTLGDAVGVLSGCTLGAASGGLEERGDESSCHLLKISRRLSMAISWALIESSVESLMAVERKLMAWRGRSSYETAGAAR